MTPTVNAKRLNLFVLLSCRKLTDTTVFNIIPVKPTFYKNISPTFSQIYQNGQNICPTIGKIGNFRTPVRGSTLTRSAEDCCGGTWWVTVHGIFLHALRSDIRVFPLYPRKDATLFSLKIRRPDSISALNRTAVPDENTVSVAVEFSSTCEFSLNRQAFLEGTFWKKSPQTPPKTLVSLRSLTSASSHLRERLRLFYQWTVTKILFSRYSFQIFSNQSSVSGSARASSQK